MTKATSTQLVIYKIEAILTTGPNGRDVVQETIDLVLTRSNFIKNFKIKAVLVKDNFGTNSTPSQTATYTLTVNITPGRIDTVKEEISAALGKSSFVQDFGIDAEHQD